MKNLISKVFMVIVACLFCVQTAFAADTWSYPSKKPDGKFGGGRGTASSPYLINNAQQLADLAWLVNDGEEFTGKYFKLTRDITLNDIEWGNDHTPTAESLKNMKDWTPIGKYSRILNDYFEGIFDGDGHAIIGMSIDIAKKWYMGLFGALNKAIVRNLTIKDCYVFGTTTDVSWVRCGMLAAYLQKSQIVNCDVVSSNVSVVLPYGFRQAGANVIPCIGGFVGQGSGSGKSLISCSFDGYIHLFVGSCGFYAAGLMGVGAPTLKNCTASGTIEMTLIKPKNKNTSHFLNVGGLCYEAEDINGCVSNMNYEINTPDDKNSQQVWKTLNLFGLCYTAKNISNSVYNGKIKIKALDGFDKSEMGSVYEVSRSINDCAFYCQLDANDLKLEPETYNSQINYYPFIGNSLNLYNS